MHFLIHRDLRANSVIRWTLTAYVSGLGAFLAFRPWLEAKRYGLGAAKYRAAILGDTESFMRPMDALDFAVNVHTDLFFDSLLAVILGAIAIRLPLGDRTRGLLIVALITGPILVAAAGTLTHLGFPLAAVVRTVSFWGLWAVQLGLALRILVYLSRPAR